MIRKRNFIITKTENGRYTIALRKHPDHPLDRNGYDTKKDARKRLNEYIKNVKEQTK